MHFKYSLGVSFASKIKFLNFGKYYLEDSYNNSRNSRTGIEFFRIE